MRKNLISLNMKGFIYLMENADIPRGKGSKISDKNLSIKPPNKLQS